MSAVRPALNDNARATNAMFFLVTGASGMGKSTVRRLVAAAFADCLETGEIATMGITPEWAIAWRQRMVERLVRRAIEVQRAGKHFLLAGDPVPPGEVLAVPSADQLGPLAVCLLDASAEVQRARLMARGDDPALLDAHVAFADWMRHHVRDPRYRPEVLTTDAWEEMRWERWMGRDTSTLPWRHHTIDTSHRTPREVADRVAPWLRQQMDEAG